jgi:hypothetical protein
VLIVLVVGICYFTGGVMVMWLCRGRIAVPNEEFWGRAGDLVMVPVRRITGREKEDGLIYGGVAADVSL